MTRTAVFLSSLFKRVEKTHDFNAKTLKDRESGGRERSLVAKKKIAGSRKPFIS